MKRLSILIAIGIAIVLVTLAAFLVTRDREYEKPHPIADRQGNVEPLESAPTEVEQVPPKSQGSAQEPQKDAGTDNPRTAQSIDELLLFFPAKHPAGDWNPADLKFDYRGYGRSEGVPTVEGVLRDARAARTSLAQRAGIKESEIVLMGDSLGGAIAVQLAAESAPRALILQSTFSSLRDVADVHYPKLSCLFGRNTLPGSQRAEDVHSNCRR